MKKISALLLYRSLLTCHFKHYKIFSKMDRITYEDFGFFKMEFPDVNFITFNLTTTKLSDFQISQLTTYFSSFGFNGYLKKTEISKSRQEVFNKNPFQNEFELDFILNVPDQKEMIQIQFSRPCEKLTVIS